jgi:hypothetical protein
MLLLDCSARISLETFLENAESLLHLIHFENVCDTGMILTLSRSLVE